MIVNENQSIYVIRNSNPDAGMGSLISGVIGQLLIAEEARSVPIVDWQFYKCLYSEETPILNSMNPWEYYFEPVARLTMSDLKSCKEVIYSDGSHPKNVPFPWANLKNFVNVFDKYIKFNQETSNFIDSGIAELGIDSKTLGVHFRAARGMRRSTNHPIQPTRTQIRNLIDHELEVNIFDKIFLASDVEEEIQFFKKRYGKFLLYFNSARFKSSNSIPPRIPGVRINHNYLLGLEVLREAYSLSLAGGLIAGFSGVSQLAEIMRQPNRKYRTFLIDNGKLSHYKILARYQFIVKSSLPARIGGLQKYNRHSEVQRLSLKKYDN